ncbi:hypothetical protein [Leifsonia sp. fls2-241-R2A-40a]|uniref:hypothetical protein n=1 Tax=Leifsonia sp. fls2-241-R2A-40a TaxID=3040290 RepID=UPI002550EABF|nr:hypothetical protein [Leifsonia sp. fls2-241-R2A-40a]
MSEENPEPDEGPQTEKAADPAGRPTLGSAYLAAIGGGSLVGRLNAQLADSMDLGKMGAVAQAQSSLISAMNATANISSLYDQGWIKGIASESARSLVAQAAFAVPQGAVAKAAVDAVRGISHPGVSSLILQAQQLIPQGAIAQAAADAVRGFANPGVGSVVAEALAATASPAMQELMKMRLPGFSLDTSLGALARAAVFEQEFTTVQKGMGAGAWGLLQGRLDTHPLLSAEVTGFARAASAPPKGPLKVPAKELHQRAERIEGILDSEPELRHELALPLAEVQAVSATDDYDVLNFGALFDARHRRGMVTGIALAFGVTVSVARFLIGAGTGQPVEMAAWDGVASGATVYLFVSGRRPGGGNDEAGGAH